MIIAKVGGKCDISHFSREYVLIKATHPTLVMAPSLWFLHVCLGQKTPALKKVKLFSWSYCRWSIGALSRAGWVAVAKLCIE